MNQRGLAVGAMLRFLGLLAVAVGGCGSSGSGVHRSECEVTCSTAGIRACAEADEGACVDDCVGWTERLADACARCVIEHSGWAGRQCSCNSAGDSCNLCGFGPGDGDCPGDPGINCTEADETCREFELANTTDSDCAAACGGADASP
jgi:hypothetical protein